MTTETKAPLPDEVEKAIKSLYERANFACNSDKIKQKSKKNLVLANKIHAHIAELEEDNKRLREALVQCESELMSIHIQHGDKAHAAEMSAGIRMANEALTKPY